MMSQCFTCGAIHDGKMENVATLFSRLVTHCRGRVMFFGFLGALNCPSSFSALPKQL